VAKILPESQESLCPAPTFGFSGRVAASANTPATDPADNRFPSQIKYIVGNEACERFSYYGMKSILALYITTVLFKTKDQATTIIHLFGFANYFMPLLGAWVSDRFWGRYHTILWISLFYCAGHGVLAMSDLVGVEGKTWCLYVGLALIAFGSGGIKPCVSAFVGDQFKPSQSHLLQKAYGAFYFSINFGSFFSFLIIPRLAREVGYGWAFGVPGILMGLATLIFYLGTRHYVRRPPSSESRSAGFVTVFLEALLQREGKPKGAGFWDTARLKYSKAEVDAAASLLPILGVFLLIPPFWALFEQSNSTWVLQGEKMVAVPLTGIAQTLLGWIFGKEISAEQMQSANPLMVMLLVPLLTLGVYPALRRWVTPLRRIGAGLFVTAFSYVLVGYLQQRIEGGDQLSILWQSVPYLVLTLGEVLVSTTGLEFAYSQAAPTMKSTIMGFWLLTTAIGNLLVSVVTTFAGGASHEGSVTSGRFYFYAGLVAVVAVLFMGVAMLYRYRDTTSPEAVKAAGGSPG
jgi:POT family proton-dependent oligopeptide transporter